MKYTLTVNQKIVIDGGHNIDISDSAILETMRAMQGATGIVKIIHNNIDFYWMAHQKLCDELPILRIKKDSMYRRIKKLIDKGYVNQHPQNKALKATYYRITKRTESIFYDFASTSEKNPIRIGNKSEVTSDENPKDKNTIDNNTIYKKEQVSALFQSDTSPELFLKKYFNEDQNSVVLRLPGQPTQKTVDRWLQFYSENYLAEQLLKFENYLQKAKTKKLREKIKSASSTINNWLKKEWIDCKDQRAVLEVFRSYWKQNIKAPFQFDRYQTSGDRLRLEMFVDGMKEAGSDPAERLRSALETLPDFWKGKRLSSILKNFADISKPAGLRAAIGKESATIKNLDWL